MNARPYRVFGPYMHPAAYRQKLRPLAADESSHLSALLYLAMAEATLIGETVQKSRRQENQK